jgi:hypothetical protein
MAKKKVDYIRFHTLCGKLLPKVRMRQRPERMTEWGDPYITTPPPSSSLELSLPLQYYVYIPKGTLFPIYRALLLTRARALV